MNIVRSKNLLFGKSPGSKNIINKHIAPLGQKLWLWFFGFYKYGAPAGALLEFKRVAQNYLYMRY